MNCKKAGNLMIKQMDDELSEQEFLKLAQHLEECECCKEDYAVYNEMLADFEGMDNLIAAPIGFEQGVMAQIADLAPEMKKSRNETILAAVIGALSAMVGLLLFFGRAQIVERWFSEIPAVLNGVGQATAQYGFVMFAVVTVVLLFQSKVWKRKVVKK